MFLGVTIIYIPRDVFCRFNVTPLILVKRFCRLTLVVRDAYYWASSMGFYQPIIGFYIYWLSERALLQCSASSVPLHFIAFHYSLHTVFIMLVFGESLSQCSMVIILLYFIHFTVDFFPLFNNYLSFLLGLGWTNPLSNRFILLAISVISELYQRLSYSKEVQYIISEVIKFF